MIACGLLLLLSFCCCSLFFVRLLVEVVSTSISFTMYRDVMLKMIVTVRYLPRDSAQLLLDFLEII